MQKEFDTVIRISSERAEIVVEQEADGVTSRKTLTPKSFAQCILESRYDDNEHFSGLLPESCLCVTLCNQSTWYFIRYPEMYADISYSRFHGWCLPSGIRRRMGKPSAHGCAW